MFFSHILYLFFVCEPILAVERLRSFGDESRLETLRAEVAQAKKRKKQLEESVALKESEVSF